VSAQRRETLLERARWAAAAICLSDKVKRKPLDFRCQVEQGQAAYFLEE